ncbi:NADPH dehydrogenase, (Old yellow enzyme) involved in small alpha,beta-unsaturated carbonyl compound [Schizosaccharomyces osmophilus]|uniref:NADPH dehydrogenase, (Old yellow enzyme) involved in small alpha,beta-unsaturated carbonyl compound n=1 Tax=Schizosaccharomyces osmophilus TaxID=2545709 RepID=A0AAE9W9W6_9SCHI|nr:NADPH dehydrogenase, (Old yellow enzyme) involved in small alpha,beta-unsaturated carbonyl compound [Schizosaccharomyces osmophilus]WBW71481.1 NADPH dehydrogenase, (Old yellow enzyme) involved in small alpha,beta-unsaturated carbonyl compound [Schizosaccharomyces osmophilus]
MTIKVENTSIHDSLLFDPIKVGNMELQHRIVHAPATRLRCHEDGMVMTDLVKEYYSQRSAIPGTFLITESIFSGPKSGGFTNIPCLYNEKHVEAWRPIVKAIHEKKCFVFMQFWNLPGELKPEYLVDQENLENISHGECPMDPTGLPAALGSVYSICGEELYMDKYMNKSSIDEHIAEYTEAAKRAVFGCGADGIEVHQVNGFLLDKFVLNGFGEKCDPNYRGTLENRVRFCLELLGSVVKAIGQERVGYRISPYSDIWKSKDHVEAHVYVVQKLRENFKKLAYLHVIEPRTYWTGHQHILREQNSLEYQKLWKQPLLSAGGHDQNSALQLTTQDNVLAVFGRYFLANPDLPFRLKYNIPLNRWNRARFYTKKSPEGYIDYPFCDEFLSKALKVENEKHPSEKQESKN